MIAPNAFSVFGGENYTRFTTKYCSDKREVLPQHTRGVRLFRDRREKAKTA